MSQGNTAPFSQSTGAVLCSSVLNVPEHTPSNATLHCTIQPHELQSCLVGDVKTSSHKLHDITCDYYLPNLIIWLRPKDHQTFPIPCHASFYIYMACIYTQNPNENGVLVLPTLLRPAACTLLMVSIRPPELLAAPALAWLFFTASSSWEVNLRMRESTSNMWPSRGKPPVTMPLWITLRRYCTSRSVMVDSACSLATSSLRAASVVLRSWWVCSLSSYALRYSSTLVRSSSTCLWGSSDSATSASSAGDAPPADPRPSPEGMPALDSDRCRC
mmetsp:Transcript_36201/g.80546  ORF Transcript_36201/g.80546 Transcript_36201/m.80546 type:complete len:273 (-) Transcript_36201:1335-2153(-)